MMIVRSVVQFTTVIVLVLSLGLHWAVLQTVAWTGMIVTYSRDASLTEAVAKTFDGKHPCPMCKAIKKARAEEQRDAQEQPVKPSAKMDLGLVWQWVVFDFFCVRERIPSPDFDASGRSYEPPKPRPRPF